MSKISKPNEIRPVLWANSKRIPEIKKRLRAKVPKITNIDVRRARLPYYEALLKEMFEEGCVDTAEHFSYLVKMENQLYMDKIIRDRFDQNPEFLLVLVQTTKKAEVMARVEGKLDESFELLFRVARKVEETGTFEWITREIYKVIFKLFIKYNFSNREIKCKIRYSYAKFISERMGLYDEAIEHLTIAMKECEGESWVTDPNMFSLLSIDVNRSYLFAIAQKVQQLKETDLAEAEKLMNFAINLVGFRFGKIDMCKYLIDWSDMLVTLKKLKKAEKVLLKGLGYAQVGEMPDYHACEISMKLGLVNFKLGKFEKSIKELQSTIEAADSHEFDELRGLSRMHLGYLFSRDEFQRIPEAIDALQKANEIFRKLNNIKLINQIEYNLATIEASKKFGDICWTIREAFRENLEPDLDNDSFEPYLKFKTWQFQEHPDWVDDRPINATNISNISNDSEEFDFGEVENVDEDSLDISIYGISYIQSLAQMNKSDAELAGLNPLYSTMPSYQSINVAYSRRTLDHSKSLLPESLANLMVSLKPI